MWKKVHQGTLRYAYKTSGGKGGPKDKAEGVAFLGAFLPRLHNCSAEVHIIWYDSCVIWWFLILKLWLVLIIFFQDADTVRRLMWIDGTMESEDSFSTVKTLLERNYACMGVTCSQVLHCFPVLKVRCSFLRLVLFWTRPLVSILQENPVQKVDSQSGQLSASLSLSSWSFCFLPLELLFSWRNDQTGQSQSSHYSSLTDSSVERGFRNYKWTLHIKGTMIQFFLQNALL